MQILYWILAISLSLAVGYWVFLADRRRAVPYPWLTSALRSLVILLTSLLLLAPSITTNKNETEKPVIVFLQDNSTSVPAALKGDTARYRKDAAELLDKLSKDYRVVRWGFGANVQSDTLFQYKQDATDISGALSQAGEFYGQQNLGAVILSTDGRFNQGANPLYTELALPGRLYTVALGDSVRQKDIRIGNVYANRTVSLNSQFEIRADIVAQRCEGYNNSVQLREVDGEAAGNAQLMVTGERYDRSVSFTVKAGHPGMHHYVLTVPPAEGELNTANNRRDVFVEVVSEKKNILIAAAAPHPDINAIREALSGLESYNLVVRTADNLPASFADYDVVILHSLPSTTNAVKQLTSYKKPVWLIMGANANNAAYNQEQTVARLNVNPMNLQPLAANYDPSFTAFNLPQNINAVMDKMPPLAVPAGRIDQNPGAQVLFYARGNMAMPLWMLQQGTRPSALLVGEGIWRWRLFEYRHFNTHSVVDEAIRQTVSFLSANSNEKPFRVEFPKYVWSDQEAITLNAYLLNASNEQVNTAEVKLILSDEIGKKQEYSMERSGKAYKLNLGIRASGIYHYTASASYEGKTYTESGSIAVHNTPLEMMETGADYPLLNSLAQKHAGHLVPGASISSLYDSIRNDRNIKPVIRTTTETIPLVDWKWYFFLILLVAVTEWLLRKYWLAQ